MTTPVVAETVDGVSYVSSAMTMTSQVLRLRCSSQQATAACLPVSVQLLTYNNDDFVDDAAAATDDDDDDNDDDVTNCCKCRQLITASTMLPCLDSLCTKCFTEVCDTHRVSTDGVAKCPRCGSRFRISEAMPHHGFMDTLVALKKIANKNVVDDNCDICKQYAIALQPVAAAEYYCIQCRQRICAACSRPHDVFPATKNHNLVGLGQDSARQVLSMNKMFFPCCANHNNIPASVHCYQCSVSLCSQCHISHSGHEVEGLTDGTHSWLTNKVKCLTENLRQQFEECKTRKAQVQKLLLERRNVIDIAEKQIRARADEMISLIRKQRDDLVNKLRSQNEQTVYTLEAVSGSLSSGLSAKKQALRFAEELLEKGSVEDMLLNCRMLNVRFSSLHVMSDGSSQLDNSICSDVSPASLIHNICSSPDSQSKL